MKPNSSLCKQDEESGNNEPQRIRLIEYLQQRDIKGAEPRLNTSTVDVAVQTELELIEDQIQLFYVDNKTHLYTHNIDQVEYVQVYQSLRQMKRRKNRKISKRKKKREAEKMKETIIVPDPFIIIHNQSEQQKQRYRRAARIQNKQTIILNQTELNQKFSKQQLKVQKSRRMDAEINLTKCICRGELQHQDYYQCEFCSNCFHYACQRRQKSNVPFQICPYCILREIESTQEIEEILCQLYLEFDKGTTLFKGQFNFKPYEYYCSQKIRNHQLELRCIQIEGNQATMTEVMWPNQCIFFLNGRKVFEVMEISKESEVRKRKDFPLRIAQFVYHQEKNIDLQRVEVKLKSNETKVFQVDEKFEIKQPLYLFGIYFTKNTSFQTVTNKMISRMKTTNQKYMRNLISNNNPEGLEVSKLTYTLLDPFSWNVIKLPVRGVHCKHAQCFDMGTYISLQLGNRTRYWKCPLCKKSTLILSEDEQQDAILDRVKNSERIPKEVVYYKSGMIEVNLQKQQEESEDEQSAKKKIKRGRQKNKRSDEQQVK